SQAVLPWRPATTPAATEMVTAVIETGSGNAFRTQTILKYNALREPTPLTQQPQDAAVFAAMGRFTAKNAGLVRSGDAALFEGTIIQSRTQEWLREIAREAQAELGARTVEEALVLMAQVQVPDIDVVGQSIRSGPHVTLAQAVLA